MEPGHRICRYGGKQGLGNRVLTRNVKGLWDPGDRRPCIAFENLIVSQVSGTPSYRRLGVWWGQIRDRRSVCIVDTLLCCRGGPVLLCRDGVQESSQSTGLGGRKEVWTSA